MLLYIFSLTLVSVITLQGMVEKWLIQVEEVMIGSLSKVSEESVTSYMQNPRGKWVQEWPGQVRYDIILVRTRCINLKVYMYRKN